MAKQLKVRGFDKKTMAKAMKSSAAGEKPPLSEGEQALLQEQQKVIDGDDSPRVLTSTEEAVLKDGLEGEQRELTDLEKAVIASGKGEHRELTDVEKAMLAEQEEASNGSGSEAEEEDEDMRPLDDSGDESGDEGEGEGNKDDEDVIHCLVSQERLEGHKNLFHCKKGDNFPVGTRHSPAEGHWFEKVSVKVNGQDVLCWRYEGEVPEGA